jgi:hypothetical protein
MKGLRNFGLALTSALLITVTSITGVDPAVAADSYGTDQYPPPGSGGGGDVPYYIKAICNRSDDWTSKDPQDCHGDYTVYDTSTPERPTVLFSIETPADSIWPAVRQGYQAAQDWCSSNSLTCAVITAVGYDVVSGWLGPAND